MIYFIILLFLIVAVLSLFLYLSISLSAEEREGFVREIRNIKSRVYNTEIEVMFLKKTLQYHEECLNPKADIANIFSAPKPEEKTDSTDCQEDVATMLEEDVLLEEVGETLVNDLEDKQKERNEANEVLNAYEATQYEGPICINKMKVRFKNRSLNGRRS